MESTRPTVEYRPRYITKLERLSHLTAEERGALQPVCDRYAFRANDYYASLINWDDPDDPIRRIIIPATDELREWGRLDASDEQSYTVAPGLQHKYAYTAVLLVNEVCGGFCRFCFRKRLFQNGNDEVTRDVGPGLAYIGAHREINNVLLTGGDPLLLSTNRLESIIKPLRRIPHVGIIRIGSKMPAFNPFRILNDPDLLTMLSRYSTRDRRVYVMVHFNHPRELTEPALRALDLLQKAGVVLCNQTPLLRGVNDDPNVLAELLNKLSYAGAPPYYLFQGRPTEGNRPFAIPVEESWEIVEKARTHCSGLAKRARLTMSHSSGKIEILGRMGRHVLMRYHRAADPQSRGRFMLFRSNPEAYWLDDYAEPVEEHPAVGRFLWAEPA